MTCRRHVPLLLAALLVAAACGARSDVDRADGSAATRPDAGTTTGDDATYTVRVLATALERFVLRKHDPATDRCTTAVFASPVGTHRPGFELSLPEDWSLERAWRGSCSERPWPEGEPPADAVEPLGAEGWGRWDDWPCTVSLDITLRFAEGGPERLRATGLDSDSCP